MIISRTPYRISFFGGGTDYPRWYREEGGATLSTTIDKYCYISCRYLPPFFGDVKHRIVWSHIETVSSISEVLHPAVRAGMHFLGFDDSVGLEIHHQGDLPSRSGIGSSSSFSVGLIKALTGLRGKMIGKHELALQAIELEQTVLEEPVGSQDQVAAAYGGFNVIRFMRGGDILVEPLTIAASRLLDLQARLMMFYTGSSRLASKVAQEVIDNLPQRERQLREMQRMVDEGVSILAGTGSLDTFGELLDESWQRKRELSASVTNSSVDSVYDAALEHGAIGGKLMGAGHSGFMVFYAPLERQEAVRRALSSYLNVPFEFENQGCSIVYYAPNQFNRLGE